jgi:hypothetical protein
LLQLHLTQLPNVVYDVLTLDHEVHRFQKESKKKLYSSTPLVASGEYTNSLMPSHATVCSTSHTLSILSMLPLVGPILTALCFALR